MLTRSSVLGKRGHQVSSSPAPSVEACEQLQTPDSTPNPKRARTTTAVEDGDGNKENIPPFKIEAVNAPLSPRSARAMRRHATSADIVTPARTRPAPRRTASASSLVPATPTAEKSDVAVMTPPPTPPTILLPLHVRIRALLRSTCNNEIEIAGRETERAAILEFITPFIEGKSLSEGECSSLFISGSPGTGKTALVNAIIRHMSATNDAAIKVVSINCMALKSVDALWERMIEELSAGPKRKASAGKKLKGREMVQSLLNSLKIKCILILDELDHIASTSQALSSIFTLTESLPSVLRLVGIANTHTLTASSSSNAFIPSSNVRTIHFAPYTPNQLQGILQSRLNTLSEGDASAQTTADVKKLLPPPTLMLLTKKIAALTGDVRSLFEVLRGAIDLAIAVTDPSDETLLSPPLASTTPKHVLAALKAYTPSAPSKTAASATSSTPVATCQSNSETVTKIHNLGLQARLVLLTILLASKRLEAGLSLSNTVSSSPKRLSTSPMKRSTSLPSTPTSKPGVGIETGPLHTYYSTVLSRSEMGLFEPISRSEFGDLMGVLEGVGIVSLSSSLCASASPSGKGRKPFGRSASFGAGLGKGGAGAVGEVRLVEGMWGDEVLRGLGVTSAAVSLDESAVDSREEEVRGIWQSEQSRLSRDIKASVTSNSNIDTFAGAFQD